MAASAGSRYVFVVRSGKTLTLARLPMSAILRCRAEVVNRPDRHSSARRDVQIISGVLEHPDRDRLTGRCLLDRGYREPSRVAGYRVRCVSNPSRSEEHTSELQS